MCGAWGGGGIYKSIFASLYFSHFLLSSFKSIPVCKHCIMIWNKMHILGHFLNFTLLWFVFHHINYLSVYCCVKYAHVCWVSLRCIITTLAFGFSFAIRLMYKSIKTQTNAVVWTYMDLQLLKRAIWELYCRNLSLSPDCTPRWVQTATTTQGTTRISKITTCWSKLFSVEALCDFIGFCWEVSPNSCVLRNATLYLFILTVNMY